MQLTQFVASEDGGSQFETIDVRLDIAREGADGYSLMTCKPLTSNAIVFVELPAGMTQDWHQAPARQLVQVLSGSIDVTTTDDECRRFDRGDIFIAADTIGRGHKTRTIDGPAVVIFIPLSDDALM